MNFWKCFYDTMTMPWIVDIFKTLVSSTEPRGWWPSDSKFEVILGAILTQNTNWKNVEKALLQLKKYNLLSAKKLYCLKAKQIAPFIKSSGYYNQKAIKIKAFLEWFANYNFSIKQIQKTFPNEKKSHELRKSLLRIHGIGPETADSILCYAFEMPYFVVDAYTIRIFGRFNSSHKESKYHIVQASVETEFFKLWQDPEITEHFNEFHALIVWLGNKYCKKRNPNCMECPLIQKCHKNIENFE